MPGEGRGIGRGAVEQPDVVDRDRSCLELDRHGSGRIEGRIRHRADELVALVVVPDLAEVGSRDDQQAAGPPGCHGCGCTSTAEDSRSCRDLSPDPSPTIPTRPDGSPARRVVPRGPTGSDALQLSVYNAAQHRRDAIHPSLLAQVPLFCFVDELSARRSSRTTPTDSGNLLNPTLTTEYQLATTN